MGDRTELARALLFALACNLDTMLAAVGQSAAGRQRSLRGGAVLALVTTAATFWAVALGAAGAELFPRLAAERLGGLALTALGLWYLLDALRGGGSCPGGSGDLPLAAALAVNNAGVGLAAGVAGLTPALAAGCSLLATVLALALGRRLGRRLTAWSSLAGPLSGILLAALGLWQLR